MRPEVSRHSAPLEHPSRHPSHPTSLPTSSPRVESQAKPVCHLIDDNYPPRGKAAVTPKLGGTAWFSFHRHRGLLPHGYRSPQNLYGTSARPVRGAGIGRGKKIHPLSASWLRGGLAARSRHAALERTRRRGPAGVSAARRKGEACAQPRNLAPATARIDRQTHRLSRRGENPATYPVAGSPPQRWGSRLIFFGGWKAWPKSAPRRLMAYDDLFRHRPPRGVQTARCLSSIR